MNEVTATVAPTGGGTPVVATADAVVEVVTAGISVTKTPSKTLVNGSGVSTAVTYTYEVENTGIVPLSGVTLTDDTAPCSTASNVSGPTKEPGDNGDDLLDPGELWTYTCTATLTKSAPTGGPTEVTNTATATGTPDMDGLPPNPQPVSGTDSATVDVVVPQIELQKTASETGVAPGAEAASWTVEATNTGDTPLYEVTVDDDKCQPMEYQSGDAGNDGIMGVGEVWIYTCSGPVVPDEGGTVATNTATVEAGDPFDGTVTADDKAEVTLHADLQVTKMAEPPFAPSGSQVTYTIVAKNVGSVPLTFKSITDTKCSPISGPASGTLAPGDSWTFTCTGTYSPDILSGEVVNQAEVVTTTTDDTAVADDDTASTVVFDPGIAIKKAATPSSLVERGQVTYDYTVTNTGNVPLADVASRIADDTCPNVQYVSGDDDANGLLTGENDLWETGPPETWHFSCTTIVTHTTTNTVVVKGTPVNPELENPVIGPDVEGRATDTVDVTQVTPPAATIVDEPARPAGGSPLFAILGLAAVCMLGGLALVGFERRRRP